LPRPFQRARSRKRSLKRLPGGNVAVHYKKRRLNPRSCSVCGAELHGVPAGASSKLSKSEKKPSRAFGGSVCPSCLREIIKKATRGAAA
jgi:large subunit ribosomal protein L34e